MFHEIKIIICALVLRSTLCVGELFWDNYWGGGRGGGYLMDGGVADTGTPLTCGRIFSQPNFGGKSADFPANYKDAYWGWYNPHFVPKSVQLKPGCSLTLLDDYGDSRIYKQSEAWSWLGSGGEVLPVGSTCCECGGCSSPSALAGLECARLYEHEGCNSCDGYRLDLRHGDKVKHFGILDNRMTSLAIRPGCQLITYYEHNFSGYRINFTKSMDLFGENWYKHISSAECLCYQTYQEPTTSTTTRPTPAPLMWLIQTTPAATTARYVETPGPTTTTTRATTMAPPTTTKATPTTTIATTSKTTKTLSTVGPAKTSAPTNTKATTTTTPKTTTTLSTSAPTTTLTTIKVPTTTTTRSPAPDSFRGTTSVLPVSQEKTEPSYVVPEDLDESTSEDDADNDDDDYEEEEDKTTAPTTIVTTKLPSGTTTTTTTNTPSTTTPTPTTTTQVEDDDDWEDFK